MKNTVLILVAVAVVIGAASMFSRAQTIQKTQTAVTNYNECTKAGYPVAESYPPVCRTPDGKSFTQDIGNELEKQDLIRVTEPRPNATVASPLTVKGEARGTWYFEASFPVRLLDTNGKELAVTPAQAQGEWMTEEFVPFAVTLTFPSTTGRGTLILEKDNPSGLPENADQLNIPLYFSAE